MKILSYLYPIFLFNFLGENVPDIMKDFQNFQLRKRDSKRTPANLNKLPELLRLQMGQANLLVAKQDFKQAADICMEIVREGTPCIRITLEILFSSMLLSLYCFFYGV